MDVQKDRQTIFSHVRTPELLCPVNDTLFLLFSSFQINPNLYVAELEKTPYLKFCTNAMQ